jgi:hypothetical protein
VPPLLFSLYQQNREKNSFALIITVETASRINTVVRNDFIIIMNSYKKFTPITGDEWL